jgi:hypothetical protein
MLSLFLTTNARSNQNPMIRAVHYLVPDLLIKKPSLLTLGFLISFE